MQNKGNDCTSYSFGDAGFVALDGSWSSAAWSCGNCGYANCGCDSCSRCGWNRCGNGCGAVVSVNAPRKRCNDGCDAYAARQREGCAQEREQRACECADTAKTPCRQYAECCDKNVHVRDMSAECGENGTRSCSDTCGKNSSNAACVQRRHRCAEYNACGNAAVQETACTTCDRCDRCSRCDRCGREQATPYTGKNKSVGMVYAVKQELDQIFETESALRSGTLFPELHKPMNGYCPGSYNCQTDEQAAAFAAWELRLYLNTHPCDKQALALFRRLCKEAEDPNYATSFLKDADCDAGWSWTDDPWPWECRSCGK